MYGIGRERRERWSMRPGSSFWLRALATGLIVAAAPHPAAGQTSPPPARSYLFFVASEATDQVTLIRYGPKGALVEHRTSVKLSPDQLAAPLGLSVSPDHRFYYVIVAHGFANGELLKVQIAADSSRRESQPPDTVRGREPLGARPAAVRVSPDGAYAWVSNGDTAAQQSSVSVVYLPQMVEVARIPTCGMPGGSSLTADGSKHYSVCGGDDVLLEIDARTMKVSRRLPLSSGNSACAPTWTEPDGIGSRIFVACNKSSEALMIDASTWSIARRIPMGDGVYRLALTHDGKLLIGTNQRGQSVSIVDLATGRETARLPVKRAGPSGVAVSPDDRYAFVAETGTASDPGTVEVIDLAALKTVATIDVGRKAGGIAFWKMQ